MEARPWEGTGGRRVDFSIWLFEQRNRDDRIGRAAFDAFPRASEEGVARGSDPPGPAGPDEGRGGFGALPEGPGRGLVGVHRRRHQRCRRASPPPGGGSGDGEGPSPRPRRSRTADRYIIRRGFRPAAQKAAREAEGDMSSTRFSLSSWTRDLRRRIQKVEGE